MCKGLFENKELGHRRHKKAEKKILHLFAAAENFASVTILQRILCKMLPPTRSDETHSQDSLHTSSQHAVGAVLEDTASVARDKGHILGSSATQ